MENALALVSLGVGILSVITVIAMNMYTLRRLHKETCEEKANEAITKLGARMESTPFGILVINRLDVIQDNQNTYNKSLLHMLRTDLLEIADEIMGIHRKRNTKSSKWNALEERLERYIILEKILDEAFESYESLGGNHGLRNSYEQCKEIIKETKKEAEE